MKIHLYDPEKKGLDSFPLAEESPELFDKVFSNVLPNAKFCVLKLKKKFGDKFCAILFNMNNVAHISVKQEFDRLMAYEKYIKKNPDYAYDYDYYRNNIYTSFQPCGEDTKALSEAVAAGQIFNTSKVPVKMGSDTFRDSGLPDRPETEEEEDALVGKIQVAFKKAVRQIEKQNRGEQNK